MWNRLPGVDPTSVKGISFKWWEVFWFCEGTFCGTYSNPLS